MHSEQKPIYLCRNSKEAYKLSQHFDSKERVWALHDFINNLFKKHPNIKMSYRVLNGVEEKLLWESSIKQYKKSFFDLSNIENLSETAMQANRLIDQFNIGENTLKSEERSEEHAFFNAWRLLFKKHCSDKNVITFNSLLKISEEHIRNGDISIEHPICFVNFELTTPIEDSFIEACKTQVDIELFKTSQIKPYIESRVFLNEEHESMQIVEWCKTQIENNKKILIVTPQLDQIIDRLTSMLDKTFHPETFTPSLSQEKRIYQFSLNTPLFHLSMVYLNLKLIELAARGTSKINEIKNILSHSGWSDGKELCQRYKLINHLERKRRGSISTKDLIEMSELIEGLNNETPFLKIHLNHIHASHHKWRTKRSPSEWIKTFDEYLKNIQSSLLAPKDSFEESIYEAWSKTNETISSLDNLMGEISIQEMLDIFQYYLKKTTHQHKHQGNFKIDILGFHETTYENYDATWIMNLNEHHWPTPHQYNPFIPIKIQHDSHINTHEKRHLNASKILDKFTHTSPFVTLSYAKKMGEEEIFPSPTLHDFVSSKLLEDINFKFKKNEFNHEFIEYIEDSTSTNIKVQQTVKSGIKLLEAQSICPAWAFYEFRLGARKIEEEDEENLTTRIRGNLFHKTLEQFWTENNSASLVRALNEKELAKKIQSITHKNIAIEKKKYPRILPEFFNIEEIRLISYLEKWIQHELKRGDFEVKETEKNIPIHLGCLNFNIKIDRIDEVNQKNIVIDYKSGATKTINEWFLNAYGELQMPFYALFASNKPIDAIAIGIINSPKPQWIGIGRDRGLLQGIKDAAAIDYQSWDDLIGFWKYRIDEAVKSYESGNAAIKFTREKDMAYCQVKPILRLPERILQFEQKKQ
ncbi:MAG: PD-(D/E)XK nuclease family protein [Candidatus Methylopumilus sp.]|jgi:probable DNA repair protein